MKRQHQVTGIAAAVGAVVAVLLYRAARSASDSDPARPSGELPPETLPPETLPPEILQGGQRSASGSSSTSGNRPAPSSAPSPTGQPVAPPDRSLSRVEPRSSGWAGWLLLGLSIAGGLVYFLDKQQGEARRSRAKGLVSSGWRAAQEQLHERFQELQARIARRDEEQGAASEGQSWMPDRLLRDQIRQALTGVMEDPRSINVRVRRGLVKLTGKVPVSRLDEVLQCVSSMPGVVEVENLLEEVSG